MLHGLSLSVRRPVVAHARGRTVARAAEVGAQPKSSIGFEDLVDVIKAVDASDVIEMEITGKRFAVSVKKQEALQAAEPVYVQAAAAPVASAPAAPVAAPTPAAVAPPAAAPAPAAEPEVLTSGVEIVAPMSGTVYRKPAPGEPSFVKEGDKVVVGQSICIIEAMKLMNEIEADVSGTLVRFVAPDTKNVEPGDVLCVIEP